MHYWIHGQIGHYIVKEPMILGHESSGIVHSVGSSVTTLKAGDKVAMEPGIPCRRCPNCKRGSYNLCPFTSFAATPPIDGTLCRYYRLPADFCYKLPSNVSLEEGALIEPLSVAVHIVRRAPVSAGQNVVVFGAGPVGLLCMAVAKAFGATSIVAADINEERLRFAKSYVATDTFLPRKEEKPEEAAERLNRECGFGSVSDFGGADVVLEASGAQACAQIGCYALRSEGVFVQGGMGKPEQDGFPVWTLMAKEATCKPSFRYKQGDYDLAVKLVASGQVRVKECITGKVPFERAEEAFGDTMKSKGIKTLIAGPA